MAKSVVVMQPYFYPYAGYFRLFTACDLFVFYDCVQFPRRGFVHRNRLPLLVGGHTASADLKWLTLPLATQPRATEIRELQFSATAQQEWTRRLATFQYLTSRRFPSPALDRAFRSVVDGAPVADYLIENLLRTTDCLGISFKWKRSSDFDIDPILRGQERIIALVKACGGSTYINPPGGRELYDGSAFEAAGIELRILDDWAGDYHSIAYDLVTVAPECIYRRIARPEAFAPRSLWPDDRPQSEGA